MFKTFIIGVVLGIAAVGAYLHFVPVVDQSRARSISTVQPNGGNIERFHVNLPTDRVMAGMSGLESEVPLGLDWPKYEFLTGTQTEVFKIRNSDETVVGVASRITGGGEQRFVEWALHMPARGTMYLLLSDGANAAGDRVGSLRAGTREFGMLSGSVKERYVANVESDTNEVHGRLELETILVAPLEEIVPAEGDEG